jgi:3-isopropylmalate/(R)-2-methylmalate dehydratase small subunit
MDGTAHVFGDEINTDLITPSDYFGEPIEVMAEHVFEPVRPSFAEELADGDLVIAGEHFGSGSSRESAPAALQTAGVGAVVVESFARIFYRNAIAIGLPVAVAPDVTEIFDDGDRAALDLDERLIENTTTGDRCRTEPIPDALQSVFDAGGLIEQYRAHGSLQLD